MDAECSRVIDQQERAAVIAELSPFQAAAHWQERAARPARAGVPDLAALVIGGQNTSPVRSEQGLPHTPGVRQVRARLPAPAALQARPRCFARAHFPQSVGTQPAPGHEQAIGAAAGIIVGERLKRLETDGPDAHRAVQADRHEPVALRGERQLGQTRRMRGTG